MSRDATGNEIEWVGSATASRVLGCRPRSLTRLAERGLISIRRLPGCHCRFLRSDVERLARASTRPASAGASDRVAARAACEC